MYSQTVPVFTRLLTNGKGWLDKAAAYAETKKFDSSVFVTSRLAPDMLSFNRQIQIAGDGAKGCVARLAGVDIPKYEDNEATFADLHARLDKTIAFISTITAAQVDGTEDKEIVLTSPRGDRKFRGEDYLRYYVQPNFFFHMTTAYNILRHNGVDIGKSDFLPRA
jgi:hypothetical protein